MQTFGEFYFLGILFLISFIIIASILVFKKQKLLPIDMKIAHYLRSNFENLAPFFIKVDQIGNINKMVLLVALITVTLFFSGHYFFSFWFIANISMVAVILNPLLKLLFKRVRPSIMHLVDSFGYSFPSGHSSGIVIILGNLLMLLPLMNFNFLVFIVTTLISVIIILTIGISRIYLGVHYASDVLAGFLLSLAYLCFTYPVLIYLYNI